MIIHFVAETVNDTSMGFFNTEDDQCLEGGGISVFKLIQ